MLDVKANRTAFIIRFLWEITLGSKHASHTRAVHSKQMLLPIVTRLVVILHLVSKDLFEFFTSLFRSLG